MKIAILQINDHQIICISCVSTINDIESVIFLDFIGRILYFMMLSRKYRINCCMVSNEHSLGKKKFHGTLKDVRNIMGDGIHYYKSFVLAHLCLINNTRWSMKIILSSRTHHSICSQPSEIIWILNEICCIFECHCIILNWLWNHIKMCSEMSPGTHPSHLGLGIDNNLLKALKSTGELLGHLCIGTLQKLQRSYIDVQSLL